MPDQLVRQSTAVLAVVVQPGTLTRAEALAQQVSRILDDAAGYADHRLALAAARELRSTLEFIARLTGELTPEQQTNTQVNLGTIWAEMAKRDKEQRED